MQLSTIDLKQELSKRQKELEEHLSLRVHTLLDEIMNEDLSETQEISPFDLVVRTILKADEEPAQSIASLMVPVNTDSSYQLDEWTISNSAAFLRDYLKKDYICHVLKTEDGIDEEKGE